MGDEELSSGGTVSCIFPLLIAIIMVNVNLVSGAVGVAELRKRRKERIEVKERVERRKERKAAFRLVTRASHGPSFAEEALFSTRDARSGPKHKNLEANKATGYTHVG